MIDIEDILNIHQFLINKFGGLHGVRDIDLLKSAIGRPFQTFDKRDLYKSPVEKSAAIIESVVGNHPFNDGNKRTGYVLMRLYLMEQGMDIRASQKEKYDFVIAIASGNLSFEGIVSWIEQHIFSL
ncbi:MAG: type II toxin-antitoxin system death-on-curing family toxin [Candidatus Heimdallarchaeota archaeon]|nr:type II toxin-antitoxin system death-on-curing family toxin [Candidatus Heimdallarchaeota archaeon]